MGPAGSTPPNKPAGLGVTHGLHHQDPPALPISFEADYPNRSRRGQKHFSQRTNSTSIEPPQTWRGLLVWQPVNLFLRRQGNRSICGAA